MTDIYGGIALGGAAVQPAETAYFTTRGSRIYTPAGNPYFLRGVFDCALDTQPATIPPSQVWAPYGGEAQWGVSVAQRLKEWGFNCAAEYSSAYVVNADQWATRNTTSPIPSVQLARFSYYAIINSGSLAPAPVLDLVKGLGAAYTGYRGNKLVDAFDPNFATYCNAAAKAMSPPQVQNSQWIIGTAVDDADDLAGFGAGPDWPTPGKAQEHIGWIVLCTAKQQGTQHCHTKLEFLEWLVSRYQTIAALNAAWGAAYAEWAALAGEDGTSLWVPKDPTMQFDDGSAMCKDLDDFMVMYLDHYFSITSQAVRGADWKHLVFGPCTLNGWNGMSRWQVLRACAEWCDVIQANCSCDEIAALTKQACMGKPLVAEFMTSANADTLTPPLRYAPDPDGLGVSSQTMRGVAYARAVAQYRRWGWAGVKWWAWTDSHGEQANWGLVDWYDRPYRRCLGSMGGQER